MIRRRIKAEHFLTCSHIVTLMSDCAAEAGLSKQKATVKHFHCVLICLGRGAKREINESIQMGAENGKTGGKNKHMYGGCGGNLLQARYCDHIRF